MLASTCLYSLYACLLISGHGIWWQLPGNCMSEIFQRAFLLISYTYLFANSDILIFVIAYDVMQLYRILGGSSSKL